MIWQTISQYHICSRQKRRYRPISRPTWPIFKTGLSSQGLFSSIKLSSYTRFGCGGMDTGTRYSTLHIMKEVGLWICIFVVLQCTHGCVHSSHYYVFAHAHARARARVGTRYSTWAIKKSMIIILTYNQSSNSTPSFECGRLSLQGSKSNEKSWILEQYTVNSSLSQLVIIRILLAL